MAIKAKVASRIFVPQISMENIVRAKIPHIYAGLVTPLLSGFVTPGNQNVPKEPHLYNRYGSVAL